MLIGLEKMKKLIEDNKYDSYHKSRRRTIQKEEATIQLTVSEAREILHEINTLNRELNDLRTMYNGVKDAIVLHYINEVITEED